MVYQRLDAVEMKVGRLTAKQAEKHNTSAVALPPITILYLHLQLKVVVLRFVGRVTLDCHHCQRECQHFSLRDATDSQEVSSVTLPWLRG
jgi:hypothetical protein